MGTLMEELKTWRTWQWKKAIIAMIVFWIIAIALLLFALGIVFLNETYGKGIGLIVFFLVICIFLTAFLAYVIPQDEQ